MADDERKSDAIGNTSKEIGYTTPPEENKQEQKQTQSKPTFFLTGVDMTKRF